MNDEWLSDITMLGEAHGLSAKTAVCTVCYMKTTSDGMYQGTLFPTCKKCHDNKKDIMSEMEKERTAWYGETGDNEPVDLQADSQREFWL
jgi:NAD-dependent SIR2 family protein deacetylase